MTQSTDRAPLPPPQNRKDGGGVVRISPVQKKAGAAAVVLNKQTLEGYSPMSVMAWVITATAEFSVTVETPNAGVYAATPEMAGDGPTAANGLVVIKGQWPSIKVTTAGDVHVMAYFNMAQWL